MRQIILALALTGTVWAQVANLRDAPPSDATPQAVEPGDHLQDFNASLLPSLPPTIPGTATQMGGTIRKIDPVRDRLELKVFGGRDFTVLFDGRTKLYRNGELSATRTLKPGESASIETVLDGKDVFAKSIHILSHTISGESHGQIVSYDPAKGELVVRDSLSTQAVRMQVSARRRYSSRRADGFNSGATGSGGVGRDLFRSAKRKSRRATYFHPGDARQRFRFQRNSLFPGFAFRKAVHCRSTGWSKVRSVVRSPEICVES